MNARSFPRAVKALRVLAGLNNAADPTERRNVGIARGALTALGVRGMGLVISLITLPLMVGYLGAERYGALMTIYSLLAWVAIADLGLGSELNTTLAVAFGREDLVAAREAVASAFWMLGAISLVVLLAGGIGWLVIDWASVFNVTTPEAVAEVGPAMGVALTFFCLGFPFSVVDRVLVSFQRGATANAWAMAGSALSLVAILVATRTREGLVALVVATSGVGLIVKVAMAGWLFISHRPALRPGWSAASRDTAARLLRRGGVFFVVQIASLVLYSTDNIIIARLLGAGQVTPYSIAWSLLGLTQLLTNAAFPYLWAAYGEAVARGDGAWARRMLRRSIVVGTGVTALLLLPLTVFGEPIIRAWVGPEAVPSPALLWWMAAWYLMLTPAQAVAAFLNAAGKVGVQAWAGIVAAIANVALSAWLARSHGPAGVIAATVVSYLVFAAIPTSIAAIRTARSLGAQVHPG